MSKDETVTNCNALKPIRCGCGGEAIAYIESMGGGFWHRIYVSCAKCGIRTPKFDTEAEAVEAWNKAMGAKDINVLDKERTAKVVSDDVIITVNGYRYHYEEYFCNACKKKVFSCDSYCSHCGAKLDWSWNDRYDC